MPRTHITSYDEAIDAYDNHIDEIAGEIAIGELRYRASHVLRHVDPIAYRTGFHDWADAEDIDTDDLDTEGLDRLPG